MDSDLLPAYFVGLAATWILLAVLGVYLAARAIQFVAARIGLSPSTRRHALLGGLLCAVALLALVVAWSEDWETKGMIWAAAAAAVAALIDLDICYEADDYRSLILSATGLSMFGVVALAGWAVIRFFGMAEF